MALKKARSAVKAATAKIQHELIPWIFIYCTLLMLSSVIHMWSHWFEISAVLGFLRAACTAAAVTGAAIIVSWWLNTGND
jgi:hypothetical protein